jgi:hypothetical protein
MAGGLVLLVLGLLPGLELRLHHYIAAITIIPLAAFPTRLSALYQGLLLGLFVNGTAAFGFASILQTPAEVSLFETFRIIHFNSFFSSDRMRPLDQPCQSGSQIQRTTMVPFLWSIRPFTGNL